VYSLPDNIHDRFLQQSFRQNALAVVSGKWIFKKQFWRLGVKARRKVHERIIEEKHWTANFCGMQKPDKKLNENTYFPNREIKRKAKTKMYEQLSMVNIFS
jgi:hypothetical protein